MKPATFKPIFKAAPKGDSPLKNVFSTLKQKGLLKRIDQYLLTRHNEENEDRKNITNSPSSARGCSRANFYQRKGTPKDGHNPRTQRIFDNGHGVHNRLQTYLEKMGVLLMREVPLVHKEDEIMGHTDGLLDLAGNLIELSILEIKSMNSRSFTALKAPKPEHIDQANVYVYCVEEHRKLLKSDYPTMKEFKLSEIYRRIIYSRRYDYLQDGSKYTREEKIRHKVNQHIQLDNILYKLVKPITKVIFLYEDKDTQEIKEYEVEHEPVILQEVLDKYRVNNWHYHNNSLPPRECKNKSDGKWCNYLTTCFE